MAGSTGCLEDQRWRRRRRGDFDRACSGQLWIGSPSGESGSLLPVVLSLGSQHQCLRSRFAYWQHIHRARSALRIASSEAAVDRSGLWHWSIRSTISAAASRPAARGIALCASYTMTLEHWSAWWDSCRGTQHQRLEYLYMCNSRAVYLRWQMAHSKSASPVSPISGTR